MENKFNCQCGYSCKLKTDLAKHQNRKYPCEYISQQRQQLTPTNNIIYTENPMQQYNNDDVIEYKKTIEFLKKEIETKNATIELLTSLLKNQPINQVIQEQDKPNIIINNIKPKKQKANDILTKKHSNAIFLGDLIEMFEIDNLERHFKYNADKNTEMLYISGMVSIITSMLDTCSKEEYPLYCSDRMRCKIYFKHQYDKDEPEKYRWKYEDKSNYRELKDLFSKLGTKINRSFKGLDDIANGKETAMFLSNVLFAGSIANNIKEIMCRVCRELPRLDCLEEDNDNDSE